MKGTVKAWMRCPNCGQTLTVTSRTDDSQFDPEETVFLAVRDERIRHSGCVKGGPPPAVVAAARAPRHVLERLLRNDRDDAVRRRDERGQA